jgi:DMSO/TMAO reductase YedYZ molybdopterin-dependent catalytic subunit
MVRTLVVMLDGPHTPEEAELHPDDPGRPYGRRIFLGMLGLGVGGVFVGARVSDALGRLLAPVTAADRTGLSDLLPAGGGFRIYTVTGSLPGRSAADYRLAVSGMVARPLSLTLGELMAMPAAALTRDFQCVTGWRVPDVKWRGVLLRDVLDAAGVSAAAKAVRFVSFDGAYTESLTMEQARRDDVLVAYEMAGGPVTRAHGGPVRLYVAPMYGYKSCKWLSRIEAVRTVQRGYWEVRGYDVDAWIGRSNGRNDKPV